MVAMMKNRNQKLEAPVSTLPPDDGIRLATAQILSRQLERGAAFLDSAESLAQQACDREAVSALSAAARLIRSNAALGAVILKAAQVEDRRRVFHEQVAAAELNPKFSKPVETPEEFDTRLEFDFNKTLPPEDRCYQFTEPKDYPPWFDDRDLDPSI
jgi:hypothetical protein